MNEEDERLLRTQFYEVMFFIIGFAAIGFMVALAL